MSVGVCALGVLSSAPAALGQRFWALWGGCSTVPGSPAGLSLGNEPCRVDSLSKNIFPLTHQE